MTFNPLFLNYCFDKNRLKNLITWSLLTAGEKRTIETVENLKELGFRFATQAGISLGPDDLKTPPEKLFLVSQAEQEIVTTQQEYRRGNLTTIEKSQHLIDTWHRASETLKQTVVNNFQLTDKLNPVYMMAFSGARGNISQVRQLAGMRGLMADPQGQIIGFPIRSNFREGLTLTEYMISCYGARKGLVDTALRTADAGYLTRRLVDVSQHMIVKAATCATSRGVLLRDLKASGKVVLSLRDRLIGRVLAQDVLAESSHTSEFTEGPGLVGPNRKTPKLSPVLQTNPLAVSHSGDTVRIAGQGRHLLASRNQEISIELASKVAFRWKEISVRSPLTCSVRHGVCQLCYGWSMSEGRLVTLGEAVGIIAAQSIGEPGTQLTMRTFHTGGVFSGDVMAEIRAPHNGTVTFPTPIQGLMIRTSHGRVAFLTKTQGKLVLRTASASTSFYGEGHDQNPNKPFAKATEVTSKDLSRTKYEPDASFSLESATILFVRQGEIVKQAQLIAEFSSLGAEINETIEAKRTLFAEIAGQVVFVTMAMGTCLKGNGEMVQVSKDLGSVCVLSGKRSTIAPLLSVYNGGCHLVNRKSLVSRASGTMIRQGAQVAIPVTSSIAAVERRRLTRVSLQVHFSGGGEFKSGAPVPWRLPLCKRSQPKGANYVQEITTGARSDCHTPPSLVRDSNPSFDAMLVLRDGMNPEHDLQFTQSSTFKDGGRLLAKTVTSHSSTPQTFSKPSSSRVDFYWFPSKYRSASSGFAWVDSRYVSSNCAAGQVFWIDEHALRNPLFCNKNSNPLKFNKIGVAIQSVGCTTSKSSLLEEDSSLSPCNSVDRLQLSLPTLSTKNPKRTGVAGSKQLLTSWFPSHAPQFQGGEETDTACEQVAHLSLPHKWNDKRDLLIVKENLQGKRTRQASCTVGWLKICPFQPLNHLCSSLPLPPLFLAKTRLKGVERETTTRVDQEHRFRFLLNQGPFFEKERLKGLQFDHFSEWGKGALYLQGRVSALGTSRFQWNQVGAETVEARVISGRRAELLAESLPEQTRSNPLSRVTRVLDRGPLKRRIFVQSVLKEWNNVHSITGGHALPSALPPIVESVILTQPAGPSLESIAPAVLLKEVAKWLRHGGLVDSYNCLYTPFGFGVMLMLNLLDKAEGGSSTPPLVEVVPKFRSQQPLPPVRLKTGWTYLPKDNAKLTICHQSTQSNDGTSLDRLCFESKLVYFDAFESSNFFYRLVDSLLSISLRLTVSQNRQVLSTIRSSEQENILSIFEHIIIQNVCYRSRNGKGIKLYDTSKRDLYGVRQSPFVALSEPAYLLTGLVLSSHCVVNSRMRQPSSSVSRDLLLFLRKLFWLAQSSAFKSNLRLTMESGLIKGPDRTGLKAFQSLFSKDLVNHESFLWLRAFPLQSQIVTNHKARYATNLFAYVSPESTVERNQITEERVVAIKLSKTRALELRVGGDDRCLQRGLESSFRGWQTSPQLVAKKIQPGPLPRKEREWYQGFYRWKQHLFKAALVKPGLIALIRSSHSHSMETVTKSKSLLMEKVPFTRMIKVAPEGWPVVRSDSIGGKYIGAPTMVDNAAQVVARILLGEKTSLTVHNKQSVTKLVSQSPAIGFVVTPLLAFKGFQTTSTTKPLQLVRFALHSFFQPRRCTSKTWSHRELNKTLPIPNTAPASLTIPYQARALGNGRQGHGYQDSSEPPGTNPLYPMPLMSLFEGELIAQQPSARAMLLTEADHFSLSTNNRNPLSAMNLVPINQRSVGQFVNLGEDISSNRSTTLSGQIVSIEKEKITLRRTQALLFYANGAMHVNHGEWVNKNAPLLTLTYQKLITGDIVQGIPKIEQFFEAPATKEGEPLHNNLQTKLRRTFQRLKLLFPLAQAAKRSLDEIQHVLVEGILKVYLSQGVRIADKHLEIVIRQMTSKGHVLDVGNTGLFQGEYVNLDRIERINLATYGKKADYEPAVLGITQASLDSDSFISAASFQETTRVLSRDSVVGKTDFLRGLKERVVLGDLIQAGTGLDDNINYGLLLGIYPAAPTGWNNSTAHSVDS